MLGAYLTFIVCALVLYASVESFTRLPITNVNVRSLKRDSVIKLNAVSFSSTKYQSGSVRPNESTRIQRLKDSLTQKQILVDISSSEFALRVELKTDDKKIDYNRLIAKLENDLNILRERENIKNSTELIERILKTKEDLTLLQQGILPKNVQTVAENNEQSDRLLRIKELRKNLPILVREDGTVDWDGAWASSKEVARFGAELWERVNGKEEGIPSLSEVFGQVQVRELKTSAIVSLEEKLDSVRKLLDEAVTAKENLGQIIRTKKREGLLTTDYDIDQIFRLDLRVRESKKLVDIISMDLDLERICVYLEQEIDASVDPNEQRQFIAEAALLDKQFRGLVTNLRLVRSNESINGFDFNLSDLPLNDSYNEELISLIDDDELNLLLNEVNDLKNRLGLDTQSSFDWGSIGVLVSDSVSKLTTGLSFYGDGCKLFIRDIRYLFTLLLKAAGGRVLKPREVNAIRRTGKDLLTVIPFTIILIIPLTPIGHVLAFSFIQKFFPDFFPSFFTEKRLNLKKLFSEIERKSDDDLNQLIGYDEDETSPVISLSAVTEYFQNLLKSLLRGNVNSAK